MGTTTVDIVDLQARQASLQQELEDDYALFGSICAVVEGTCPLGACHEEWQEFETRREEADRTGKEYHRLKQRYEQIADKRTRIRETESKLRKLEGGRKLLSSRIGAAAYEAYANGDLKEICDTFYASYHEQSVQASALLSQGGFSKFKGEVQRKMLQSKSYALFVSAGNSLLEKLQYRLLEDSALVAETDAFLEREKQLKEDLLEDKQSVTDLEGKTDKARLDEAESAMNEKEKQFKQVAVDYGKKLYDQVSPETIRNLVGVKGYTQGLQIVRKLDEIEQCKAQIVQRKNQMEAEELQAENELDLQKIAHLKEQKESIDRQIAQVELSLSERAKRIAELGGGPHAQ